MEFKGTKGKWNISTDDKGNHYMSVKNNYQFVKIYSGKSEFIVETQNANALLISKAPEMLEMLKEFYSTNSSHEITLSKLQDKAGKLIKEATELKSE